MPTLQIELSTKRKDRLDNYLEMFPEYKKEILPELLHYFLENNQQEFYQWFSDKQEPDDDIIPDSDPIEEDVFGGTRPTSTDDLPPGSTEEDLETAQNQQQSTSIDDIFDDIESLGEQ